MQLLNNVFFGQLGVKTSKAFRLLCHSITACAPAAATFISNSNPTNKNSFLTQNSRWSVKPIGTKVMPLNKAALDELAEGVEILL